MASRIHNPARTLTQSAVPLLNPQRRFRLESAILLLVAGLFVLLSQQQQWFAAQDRVLYDATITRISAPLDPDTVIVGIDDQTLYQYGPWPWPRDLQASLLRAVQAQQPAAVTLDIVYAGETANDLSLVQAAQQVETLALPLMVESLGQGQQHIEVLPFSDLLSAASLVGHVHIELDDDAIARGTHLYQGVGTAHWPHLMAVLASQRGAKVPSSCANDQLQSLFLQKCGYIRFTFAGPGGTYPQISAAQLLQIDSTNEELLSRALRGKNVLIGLTASGVGDWVTTPLSGNSGPISGVEFNANLYSALLNDTTITAAPEWLTAILACLLVGVCSILLPRLRPKLMLGVTAFLAIAPIVATSALIPLTGIHLPLANATVAVILIYPLWSWRRHEIAWGFINAELNRIDREQQEWLATTGGTRLHQDRYEVLNHLSKMLGSELTVAPAIENGVVIEAAGKTDITLAESALLAHAAKQYFTQPQVDPGLPGEVLAAQIQRLHKRAAEVREGRAMGLAGLGRMSNGVLILSAFGEIRFMNDAAAQLLQVDRTALGSIPEVLSAVTPPLGQSWDDITRQVVLAHEPIHFEGHSADGTPIFVSAEPLGSNTTEHFSALWVVTFADLSAIRTAEAQREEALAFLSHDIRSPLVSVLALIRGAPEQNELLADIERYTQKGLATSEQFLQLSRLQLQSSFERYELALEQVIHNAVEQVFVLARDKDINFQLIGALGEEALDEGTWIMGNGELLERALVNLLGNAIKYSEANSEVLVSLENYGDHVMLSIKDQGYGIPAHELAHIFDPFFRSAEPKLANNRGAGLGLRFVKTVFERHEGSIDVTSQWGQGTEFVITLPRLPA